MILAYRAACKTETEEPFASYNSSNKQQTTQGGAHWENGAGVFFVNEISFSQCLVGDCSSCLWAVIMKRLSPGHLTNDDNDELTIRIQMGLNHRGIS